MEIKRYEGTGRMSRAVVHNNTVYLRGNSKFIKTPATAPSIATWAMVLVRVLSIAFPLLNTCSLIFISPFRNYSFGCMCRKKENFLYPVSADTGKPPETKLRGH